MQLNHEMVATCQPVCDSPWREKRQRRRSATFLHRWLNSRPMLWFHPSNFIHGSLMKLIMMARLPSCSPPLLWWLDRWLNILFIVSCSLNFIEMRANGRDEDSEQSIFTSSSWNNSISSRVLRAARNALMDSATSNFHLREEFLFEASRRRSFKANELSGVNISRIRRTHYCGE